MPLSFSGPDSFYSADEDAWWSAVDKALKGRARSSLSCLGEDGTEILPIYKRRADTPAQVLRRVPGDWAIVQRIDLPDLKAANRQILDDLTGGAGGLELVLEAAGAGIPIESVSDLKTVLENVELNLISVRLTAGRRSLDMLDAFLQVVADGGWAEAEGEVSAVYDPFADTACAATVAADRKQIVARVKAIAETCASKASPARFLAADGAYWHNKGANAAQELAICLATAVYNLRLLEEAGTLPETWADRLSFNLAADADQFGTISKARSLRKLWSSVLAGADLPQSPALLHMTTSYRMLTKRDPWVNLLRNTVAAFAAGIGGADSVCVHPHTRAVGLPDAFARRLARNTQAILLEESNLGKVVDPAAGSGAIEDRTGKLCAAAWGLFQKIEAAGGMQMALASGLIGDEISRTKAQIEMAVARRKRPVTGVSEFPDLAEKAVEVLSRDADTSGDRAGAWRLAEPFEALRDAASGVEAQTGKPPEVFLATLGPLAQFTARATWTSNAFAAGGINAVGAAVFDTLDDMIAAYTETGTAIACIVSSDNIYEEQAEEAAGRLKAAGVTSLYMAGKPGSKEQDYRAAGIDTFIFAGCDILELLRNAQTELEVQA